MKGAAKLLKIVRDKGFSACLYHTKDGAHQYRFEIKGQDATIFADTELYLDAVIGEFLFYSGFVTTIKNAVGEVILTRQCELQKRDIVTIQPSQFYINAQKLADCKKWINGADDIFVPVWENGGKVVALDGHTRLRAALDLGYGQVYTYRDSCDEYKPNFVNEARARGIHSVADMKVLDDEEYRINWHGYCDAFFRRA